MPRKKCPHHFDSYQPTSMGPFSWQCEYGHCPLVIPKITCADLCRPIHAIINYSTFIFPFESGNCVKEGKKLQKKIIPGKQKELLFCSYWSAIMWKKYIADTSFNFKDYNFCVNFIVLTRS